MRPSLALLLLGASRMDVTVVYIPNLLRHLGTGWSEDQLISGRVAPLGLR